jgi:hypothetical protein
MSFHFSQLNECIEWMQTPQHIQRVYVPPHFFSGCRDHMRCPDASGTNGPEEVYVWRKRG